MPRAWASRVAKPFSLGVVAQGFSAATNFALAVLGGQILGPAGLGRLLIGFAAYIMLLGFLRALVTEPMIARTTEASARADLASRSALTIAFAASLAAAALLALIGLLLPTQVGHGMLLFAPWLVPALVQDTARSIVFRDRTRPSVALSDATWLVAMGAVVPVAVAVDSEWMIVAAWGFGAIAGAAVALKQAGWRPVSLGRAVAWWKQEARPLAGWLGTQALLYNVASYATVLLLAAVLGAAAYGGFRAVQSVFAPLSLLAPALALPGLPMVSRVIREGNRPAIRVAVQYAAMITAVTAVYVGILYFVPAILPFLFGDDFSRFESIIAPVGLWQVLAAPTFGLLLFLKAAQRGRTLLWLGTVNALLYMGLTVALGAAYGVSGAAWGAAISAAAGLVILGFVFLPHFRAPSTDVPQNA